MLSIKLLIIKMHLLLEKKLIFYLKYWTKNEHFALNFEQNVSSMGQSLESLKL